MTGGRENADSNRSALLSRLDIADWERAIRERTGGSKTNAAPALLNQWNPPDCGKIDIKIAPDGAWYYRDGPITRHSLVRLFASILRRENDGVYYLVTPVEKFAIEVTDAPFLGVELKVEQKGESSRQKLYFRTNVDDIVCVNKEHPIRFDGDPATEGLRPYFIVRNHLEALVTRSLYYDLVELAVEESVGDINKLGIWSSGTFFPMATAQFDSEL